MGKISFEKVAFFASLLLLVWLYGFATSARGWFPNDLLARAWEQGQALVARSVDMPRSDHIQKRVHERVGARVVRPEEMQPGLTLIQSLWREFDWHPGLKLIDASGQPVHEWQVRAAELFPEPPESRTRRAPDATNIHGTHLFPNGDVLVNLSYVGVARLDACSRPLWTLPAGNHHSIAPDEDGTFWISAGSWEPLNDGQARPGLPRSVYHDRLMHVSGDGEILQEIDLLDLLYRNDLQRHIAKGSAYRPSQKPEDITHLNDVEPLSASLANEYPLFEAGDLVVSVHHLDLVFVFDPRTGRVKWHASDPFIQQHDPDFIGDGWIGVFDNNRDGTDRGTMLGGSRIVLIQPHTDSVRIVFPTSMSEPLYTEVQGEWQQLENGNMLLTESKPGRVVEVARDGSTVWDWVVAPYSDDEIPEVSDATRYDLGRADVEAWPCSPGNTTDRTEETNS